MKPLINTIFKRIIVTFLLLTSLLFPVKLIAKHVTPDNVRKVALNVFSNRLYIDKAQIQVFEEIPISDNGEVVYTIFNLLPHGHIVVSNDDAVEPVLGYGLESHIDFGNIPPALKYLLEEYKTEISVAKKQKLTASNSVKTKWSNYLSDDYNLNLKSYSVGDYLLETNWAQELSYNDSCPDDPVTNNECVVGCVGVAIGQVLNYWGCRVFPDSTVSYTPLRFSSPLTVNFYNQNYDWDYMTTVPAVTAQFLYHCALAVHSDFGDHDIGTFSNIYLAQSALINYFGFNANYPITKASNTDSQWINLLKDEIDEERPVIYTGKCDTCSVGHAWVIDGYDIYNKFHCNWGWSGQGNDWYSLTDLTPDDDDYTNDQRAIINIYPKIDACSGLNGADLICSTESYSVTIPSTASVQWSKSSNLNQVGGNTSATYTVSPGTVGTGYVTATIKNSQGQTFLTRTKNVQVSGYRPEIYDLPSSLCEGTTYVVYGSSSQGGYYYWEVYGGTILGGQGTNCMSFSTNMLVPPNTSSSVGVSLTINSDCNTLLTGGVNVPVYDCSGGGMMLVFSPNPTISETMLTIKSVSEEITVDETVLWEFEVYDNIQNLKEKKINQKGKNAMIQTLGWKEGVYIVRVLYKDEVITGKLVIKK